MKKKIKSLFFIILVSSTMLFVSCDLLALFIGSGALNFTAVTEVPLDDYQMYVPSGLTTPNTQPSGDFDGAVVRNSDGDFCGFVSVTSLYGTESDATSVLGYRKDLVEGESNSSSVTLISQKQNTAGDMINAQYTFVLTAAMTINDLNNQLLQLIGASTESGTIANLPSNLTGSTTYTTFIFNLTVIYIDSTEVIIIVSLVPSSTSSNYDTLVDGFNDGTNIGSSTSTVQTKTDTFTASSGSNLADFLFVIDNSGSMGNEQTAISSAATEFWAKMTSAGLDFKAGVVTTDSSTLRGSGFTSVKATFENDVKPGTWGSATERGIYYAEDALKSLADGDLKDGTVTVAGYPRTGASLSVIIMSDEPSQYWGTFDPSDNLFIDRDYKVYSIINISSAGQYDDLSNSTGGLVANIADTSQFPNIMTQIAAAAGGATSSYVLNQNPISSTIAVYVNNSLVPNNTTNGWAYVESNNSIVFYGSYIPSSGETVSIVYNYIQ